MASNVAPNARVTDELPSVDTLWLDALQRISSRAAHELKGALNGVSVNLEVVRSRSERPDAPASAVAKFAQSATDQLTAVIAMTDALLTLARPSREPVDVGLAIRRIGVLLASSAKADRRTLEFEGSMDGLGTTSAPGNTTRMALAAALLAALDASMHVVCSAAGSDNAALVVRIECRDGAVAPLDADAVAVAAEQGVELHAESSTISISFPR